MDIMIETMTAEEATERLRAMGMQISPTLLRLGLQQKIYPFGDYIATDKSCRCFIYKKLFDQWVAERASA